MHQAQAGYEGRLIKVLLSHLLFIFSTILLSGATQSQDGGEAEGEGGAAEGGFLQLDQEGFSMFINANENMGERTWRLLVKT